jgi:hypothetical protein
VRRPRTGLLAAIVGIVAVGATAAATVPSHHSATVLPVVAGGGEAGVVRASLVCPDLMIIPGTLNTTVAVGTGRPGAGSVRLSPAVGTAKGPAAPVLAAGQQVGRYAGPLTGPLTLSAQGALTGSLVAEQIARANKTTNRGWAEARCEPPRSDQWFVGAATSPGDTPVLEIANPTDTTAVYDVSVLTAKGRSDPSVGNNLTLKARQVVTTQLSSFSPDSPVTAVEVRTTTGRVSAAVRDIRTSGETFLGTDWVPVGTPSQVVTIAGYPSSVTGQAPTRVLYVGVPGGTDATVRVQVTSTEGTYVPVGLDSLAISAGTLRTIDLTKILANHPGTVTVTSDDPTVPVVAGGLIDAASTKGTGTHEIAFLGSASALRGAALVPIVYTYGDGGNADSDLVLSAPKGAATATLLVTPPHGASGEAHLAVPAGTTVEQSLRALGVPDGSSVTVVPGASSGPLYVVRLIAENGALGPLLSSFTLVGAPPAEKIPAVVQAPIGK